MLTESPNLEAVEPKETCMIGEDDEPEDDAICTTYVD